MIGGCGGVEANVRRVINTSIAAKQEVLDGLEAHRNGITGLENVELRSTKVHSFLALGLGAGKDNDVAAHGSSQLDSNVTKSTNAHDGDAVSRANAILAQDGPDSSTGAHERSGIRGVITIGDGVDAVGVPDGTVAEGSVVEVVKTVLLLVLAVLIPA